MNTQSIYNGLDYTTKEINRNFKIKVNGIVNGKKVNVLVGVSGLIKIVGDVPGVDRHVIRYRTHKDWTNYRNNNPYSNK